MTTDDSSINDGGIDEQHDTLTLSDDHGLDARTESDIAKLLSDGNLNDDELDQLTNELAAFDDLPPEKRDEHRKRFLSEFHREVVRVEATNGLLPPPTMLAGYEETLPGAADRIFRMAETQQAHRISIEDMVVSGNIISERIGTIAGGLVALVAIVGAMVLIAIGKSLEGFGLVVLEAGGAAAVFLKTRTEGGKELQAKRKQADSGGVQGRES